MKGCLEPESLRRRRRGEWNVGGGGRGEEVEGVSMGGQSLDSWGDGGMEKKRGKRGKLRTGGPKGEDQEARKWCEHEMSQGYSDDKWGEARHWRPGQEALFQDVNCLPAALKTAWGRGCFCEN